MKPRRPGDPARLVASSEKAKAELGWKPQISEIDRILASAWEWQQQRYTR
jgi:UDP-glucose 4-epimerase